MLYKIIRKICSKTMRRNRELLEEKKKCYNELRTLDYLMVASNTCSFNEV